jgi:hypothetical protein
VSGAIRIAEIAAGLLDSWGFHFYRRAASLRADDLMVRGKVSELLAAARVSVQAAERTYRMEFLPPPSREKPRPDAASVHDAQMLERLGAAIGRLEGRVRTLPVPEPDRMSELVRREADTLARLLDADKELVGHAEFLRSILHDATAAWMLANADTLSEQIAALETALQARRDLLVF